MIEKEKFEGLLRSIMPHVNAIVETLSDDESNESITVTVDKSGYLNVLYDEAEYTQFSPVELGKVRLTYQVKL